MYKKYKIKKKKHINLPMIIILLIILTSIMSYGYAYFSDKLVITGKANAISQTSEDIGKSIYNYTAINSWGTGTSASNPKYYQIRISITNYDGDLSSWTISFDVQDGIIPEKINAWSASSTKVSGNTVTMVCQPWNGNIADGNTVNIEFQLPFASSEPLNITNMKFNDKFINLSPTENKNKGPTKK